jgi:uncharacterized protein (TIGR02391 family)
LRVLEGQAMAARKSNPPIPLRPSDLQDATLPDAIRKLERRLEQLRKVDPKSNAGDDFTVMAETVCTPLNATLIEIFGPHTNELDRAQVIPDNFLPAYYYEGMSRADFVDAFNNGLNLATSRIETELSILRERVDDGAPDSVAAALRAYGGLDLHADIAAAAGQLFRDGHYSNAIEDAVKALNALVRYRSGLELDGSNLMEAAFAPKNPVLSFNDLTDQSDLDEQRGFMQMFSGAVAGLRNPRAHKLIKDDPERALEFIAFISLLAKLASAAKKVR